MKNILSLTVVALVLVQCNTHRSEKTSYIEIKHVGAEQKPIKTLLISTKVVSIDVKGDSVQINNQKPELLTGRDQDIFSSGDYSVLLIDSVTFQKMVNFVHDHPDSFQNITKEKYSDIVYSIIIDGKVFNISYKRENNFFSQLTSFLKAENCDKKSVAALISDFRYVSHLRFDSTK